MQLYLPTTVERLAESNQAGACYLQFVPVQDVQTFPAEVRGVVVDPIVLQMGRNWHTVYPTRWTQDFKDVWERKDGVTSSKASLSCIIPKDRAALLHGLWQLHRGRFVVLHHDLNGTVKVIGSKLVPAMLSMVELAHGRRPGNDRNEYELQVTLQSRSACPFYGAVPPEPGSPDDCPTLAQYLADTDWDDIEPLLNEQQIEDATDSLAPTCPTLCTLLDEAITVGTGGGTPVDEVLVTAAGTAAANGTYERVGTTNGRGYYYNGEHSIGWNGSQWQIDAIYHSTDDVAYPWEVTTWVAGFYGEPPLPTVTQVGAGDPSDASAVTDCLSPEQAEVLYEALGGDGEDATAKVNGTTYGTVAPGDDIDIQVVRASDNSAIGTVTPGVSVSIPSGRAMTTNGLVEVVSVPPGVDVPLPQSVINYQMADGSASPTPLGPYDTLYSAGTLKGGAAPRFVVRRASDGTTIIATGDIANPFVELSPQEVRNSADAVVSYHEVDDPGVAPDATIQLKDSSGTNIGSPVGVPSGTSANITAPDGTVTVRNLNGTALGSPSVKSNGTANYTAPIPMKMGWGAGDADTLEWTVTDAEAGTYNSYTQDGGSGTITYSKNGAAFAALSGTITLAVGNTIKVRRTTTTNAGYSTWAP